MELKQDREQGNEKEQLAAHGGVGHLEEVARHDRRLVRLGEEVETETCKTFDDTVLVVDGGDGVDRGVVAVPEVVGGYLNFSL